jgi:O-antigen/teichoic acid export membrane protein
MIALHKHMPRDLLALNTLAIFAMRVFGAVTGLIYWAIAARTMAPAAVGVASGAVSAATLIAGLAQLGLGYGIVRHLPHEEDSDALINLSVVISAGVSLLFTLLFLATIQLWSSELITLQTDALLLGIFVALAVSTAATQLFHWIFLATGRVDFSLWKMSLQSILAIALLVAFLPWIGGVQANLAAYTFSTLIGLAVCFWPLLRLARPNHGWSLKLRAEQSGSFANYSLLNFAADQFQRLPDTLLPLLIIQQFGVQQGAYFFIVWTIGRGMVAWVNSIAESLFAAGSRQPDQIGPFTKRALKIGIALSAALIVGTLLFGRLLLSLYGEEYVREGQALLVIIALSALPSVLSYTLVSVLRIRRQLRAVSLIMAASAGAGLAGCALGMRWGFNGTGLGWLVSQVLVLIGVAVWLYWRRNDAGTPGAK